MNSSETMLGNNC